MRREIIDILKENGIDPDICPLPMSEQTAYQIVEAAILGALEEMDENQETMR